MRFECAIWATKISGWYSIPNVHAIWAINEQRSLSSNICTSSLLLRAFCTSRERGKTVHLLFEIFFIRIFFSRLCSNKNICVLSHSTYTSSLLNAPLPIFKYFDFSSQFYSDYKVIRFEEATLYSVFLYEPIFVLVMIRKRIFWGGRCNMDTNVVAKLFQWFEKFYPEFVETFILFIKQNFNPVWKIQTLTPSSKLQFTT